MIPVDIPIELAFSVNNPFKVIQFWKEDMIYLLLTGDPFLEGNDGNTLCLNFGYENSQEKELRLAATLADLQSNYIEKTGTDGVKVDWNPILI